MQSCHIHYASLRSVCQPLRYAPCPAGSHNIALCLAPLHNCSMQQCAPGAARSCQRAKARGKGGVKKCGPGAARTVSAPRRDSKSNERAPPKAKPARRSARKRQRARIARAALCRQSEERQKKTTATATTTATPPLANPTPSAKAWSACSRAKKQARQHKALARATAKSARLERREPPARQGARQRQ